MAARVAGTEVRDVVVTRRSPSGRAIEIRVTTDAAEIVISRFDLRQALEVPEMLFTVQKARGAQGETEFVFLGRGWGHGVGLCQIGAYGMALGRSELRPDSPPLLYQHRYSDVGQRRGVAALFPVTGKSTVDSQQSTVLSS
jgi:hypothetical protein